MLAGMALQLWMASLQDLGVSGSIEKRAVSNVVRVLGYTPSKPAALVAAIVYITCGICFFWHVIRRRNWWGLCLPIGSVAMGLGFILRVMLNNPDHQKRGPFVAEEILTACSPATFLAFNYIVHGRLLGKCMGKRHSYIPPNYVSWFFVFSDIFTFVVQVHLYVFPKAAGTAMFTKTSTLNTGKTVFQVGVILQSASYYIFFILYFLSWRSCRKEGIATGREAWWKIYKLVGVSSFFITVRTIFRIAESCSDPGTAIRTREVYLYVFDTLPLFLAIVGYIFYWPGPYLERDSIADAVPMEKVSTSSV
ncbi:RTA1 like protein-domain-containing protein [Lentinula aciculospora]|uniref:RTA1 like protein-domain-containing protein n=1 Tax=Lentinula aciculospora TaxID=153920 RepID=A0A9W9ACV9_9AGAR|nr:RTA1 like protein-domain-containing protein [Lentinula aciculospora]